jgi:hypothetical protein
VPSSNGEAPRAPLTLSETLYIETKDGVELAFEVVGILEDPDDGASYAILMHEPAGESDGEFIVTDLEGNLLENEALAQEIVKDFLEYAREGDDE